MKKNTIILLIISILILIFAITFYKLSLNSTKETDLSNFSNNSITSNEIIQNNTNPDSDGNTNNTVTSTEEIETDDNDIEFNLNYPESNLFTFTDKENIEKSISDFSDKPIVILFTDFSNKLEESTDFLSIMNSFYDEYKDDVNFICIDKEKNINAESEIKSFKDIDGIQKYSIEELPTLIFINKDSKVVNQVSKITLDSFDANMDLMLENY